MSVPIRWPLNWSLWCTWVLHLITTRTSCSCIIPTILNLFLHKHFLMSSCFVHTYQSSNYWEWWGWSWYPCTWWLWWWPTTCCCTTFSSTSTTSFMHVWICCSSPLTSRRPHKAASKHCLPVGIPAVPPAPVCHSGHKHCVPHQPGNIYSDDCHLVNQHKNINRDKASTPSRSRIPGSFPNAAPSNISVPDMTATNLCENEIEHIIREGRGVLNTYLLSKVIQLDNTTMDLFKKPICKWIYRDIHKLPADEIAEWKATCHK